jgi:hypothetical protein
MAFVMYRYELGSNRLMKFVPLVVQVALDLEAVEKSKPTLSLPCRLRPNLARIDPSLR